MDFILILLVYAILMKSKGKTIISLHRQNPNKEDGVCSSVSENLLFNGKFNFQQ